MITVAQEQVKKHYSQKTIVEQRLDIYSFLLKKST